MDIVRVVLTYVLELYLLLLIGRMVISWIQSFSRSWHPTGPILVVAEAIYTATDPPLRLLRRYIPVLRLGSVALDLSFMVVFFMILVLLQVVRYV